MADHRDFLGQGDVLEAVHDEGDLLRLTARLGDLRHLLEVVDEDHEAAVARQGPVLLDELADVVDRARRLGATEQEEVLAVAGDPIERGPEPRVAGELRRSATFGDPGPEDLLADVLDLDRTGLVGKVGERRLHRDQAIEEVLLVVLEADVEDVGLAAGCDVPGHLEGHRRLAGALCATDQHELAGAQAGADRLVEGGEAERDGLVLADLAGRDLVVEIDKNVERRTGRHAARYRNPGARPGQGRRQG